jgi:hypothetical protein
MIVEEADRHLTILDFDQLALEPPASDERARIQLRIETHARTCATCAARHADHGARVAHFRAAVFPRTAEAVSARGSHSLRRRWAAWLAVPVAVALLALVVGRHRGGRLAREAADDTLGVKGDALFQVFARRNGSGDDGPPVVHVSNGMRLAAGDALRFVLFPGDMPYALIASVDGAGQVNIYFPFHGEESGFASGRGAVAVPGSIVLDAAPGPERVFVIYSVRALRASAVRAALAPTAAAGASAIRGLKAVPIEGTVQASLVFEKEDAR